MVDTAALEGVKQCLQDGRSFILTTHVNPDGDGLGSEAALAAYLEEQGKSVQILNSSPVPPNYKFLDQEAKMEVYDPNTHYRRLTSADYVVILDISDWDRLKQLGQDIREHPIRKIVIDHHPTDEGFGDFRLIDETASSTGELIFNVLEHCGARITRDIAQALYASIMTDTGSFRFSNTTSRALRISSELLETGIAAHKIYQEIYERQPLSKIRLFARVLSTLRLAQDGRVAWITIPKQMLQKNGARPHDTEGFADYPRVLDGVEVSILFLEMDSGVKVSLRSKGNYVINGIAQKFGGGGHRFAAGVLMPGEMSDNVDRILEEVAFLFN